MADDPHLHRWDDEPPQYGKHLPRLLCRFHVPLLRARYTAADKHGWFDLGIIWGLKTYHFGHEVVLRCVGSISAFKDAS
jgi:hypothetical protein